MTKITDGEAVAKLLLDGYLNNFQTVHQDFMEIMAGQKQEIRENCTYLGFAWLKGLSEVSYYDLRNEASKLLADDICMHMEQEPKIHHIAYGGTDEMEVDSHSDEQVAQLLASYLTADSRNGYQGFISYALHAHRTLQQNLTRFFVEWFHKEKEESIFLKNASMICHRHVLCYI